MKIAVLITTFNRKEKTLACLHSLGEQQLPAGVSLDIFLTDDASKDGTAQAVRDNFPEVHLYHGTGRLYWAGGTRNSWVMAAKTNPDHYLLLNDDTLLFKHAVPSLLQTSIDFYREHANHAICIGSTRDPDSEVITYGGRKSHQWNRNRSFLIQPAGHYIECDLGNANIMFVPAPIVEKIGFLSEEYTHMLADFDYTLRAKKNGFSAIVAPGVLGICKRDHGKNWKSAKVRLSERIEYLYNVKGLAYHEYLTFIRKHFPLHLPAAFVKLWLKTLFPIVYDTFKK